MDESSKSFGSGFDEDAQPIKKRKGKWWIIPIAVVLTIAVIGAIFWKPLLLTFAPKVYLSMAASNTMEALEERRKGSPADLLETASACLNNGTMVMEQSYYGFSASTVTLRSDMEAKQWALDYKADALFATIEANLYMDADCMALRIPGSDYYGLTYDTFGEDLRNSELGAQLSDEEIQFYEQSVQKIDDQLQMLGDKNAQEPYIQILTEYLEDLKADTGSQTIELESDAYTAHTVAFTMTVEEMVALMEQMVEQMEADGVSSAAEMRSALNEIGEEMSGYADLTFYIYDMNICAIGLDFDLINEDEAESPVGIELLLKLGLDPTNSDIEADLYVCLYGNEIQLNVTSSVDREKDTYENTILIDGFENTLKADGTVEQSDVYFRLTTNWNRKSGVLGFWVNNTEFTLDVNETEDGLEFVIDDFSGLLEALGTEYSDMSSMDCSVKITFSEDCEIEKPNYINLDQIKADDLNDLFGSTDEEEIDPGFTYGGDQTLW